MSTVFSIGNHIEVAEEKIEKARRKMRPDCTDCKAHYLKRNGIFLMYDERPKEALPVYTEAVDLFRELGNDLEQAKCFINRGVIKSILHEFESALEDEERALDVLGSDSGHYIVIAEINRASFLTRMGRRSEARERIEEAQESLSGMKQVDRPKLVLRWIKSLLLEDTGNKNDRKIAGQMLDRVEIAMQSRGMERERRVLLADRARIARAPYTIKQIARKGLAIETSRRVRACIEAVIAHPTRDNICKWRNSLDSYVPSFTETA